VNLICGTDERGKKYISLFSVEEPERMNLGILDIYGRE
jgi:hypothetical protein